MNKLDELFAKQKDLMKERNKDFVAPTYQCEICKDTGYVLSLDEKGNQEATECKCIMKKRAMRRLKKSGLLELANIYTFDKYIPTEQWQKTVINSAKDYLVNAETEWLFVAGQTGAGKTHVCTAVCLELINQGLDVRYFRWRDEGAEAKRLINDYSYNDFMSEYLNCDVLYIDDLFKCKYNEEKRKYPVTDGDVNLAYSMLNYRYNARKKTIISSELTLTIIEEQADAAVAGRIQEMANKYCLNIKRDDYRNYRKRHEEI